MITFYQSHWHLLPSLATTRRTVASACSRRSAGPQPSLWTEVVRRANQPPRSPHVAPPSRLELKRRHCWPLELAASRWAEVLLRAQHITRYCYSSGSLSALPRHSPPGHPEQHNPGRPARQQSSLGPKQIDGCQITVHALPTAPSSDALSPTRRPRVRGKASSSTGCRQDALPTSGEGIPGRCSSAGIPSLVQVSST